MPQLIIVGLAIWVAYIVLTYVAQVAFIAIWPVLAGWLVFIASRAVFRSNTEAEIESRLTELIEFESTPARLAFKVHGDSGKIIKPDDNEAVVTVVASIVASGLVYYGLHAGGQFASITVGTNFPAGVTSFVGFAMVAGGLAGAVAFTRSKSPHNDFVRGVVTSRVNSLNSQAAKAADFDAEAAKNTALRVSMGGSPEQARSSLLLAIQSNLHKIITGSRSIQALLDERTEELRIENATLTELDRKRTSLGSTYDFACREANRVGNEAVFRYLDLVAKGITSLRELVVQSKWAEFSQQIDGAQDELRRLLDNIDQLGQAETAEEFAEEPQSNDVQDNPYATLGVRSDLSNEDLKSVYRSLAQIYHPDKGRATDHRKFQEIQRAWQAICSERGI